MVAEVFREEVAEVAYLGATDDHHGGTLRSELHFNISDDVRSLAAKVQYF